jgi:hypothetical protein
MIGTCVAFKLLFILDLDFSERFVLLLLLLLFLFVVFVVIAVIFVVDLLGFLWVFFLIQSRASFSDLFT